MDFVLVLCFVFDGNKRFFVAKTHKINGWNFSIFIYFIMKALELRIIRN